MPVAAGFVTWCSACGWNLTGGVAGSPRPRRLDRAVERLASTFDERLARELLSAESLEPDLTPARLAAYAIAGAVHLTTAGLVLGAGLLAALTFPNPFALAGAAAMLGFAWLVRPRLGTPPEQGLVPLSETPALRALLDEIAAVLETATVDLLVVDGELNASWGVVGLRRRRVLTIGLPLFAALGAEERVALLAHELAHGRNGDLRRGMFVGSALNTLEELYSTMLPGESLLTHSAMGILDLLSRFLLWLLAQPVRALLWVELHLLLRDMQRAEYLADSLAASVAGTEAAVSLEETVLLQATIEMCIHDAAHKKEARELLFPTIRAKVRAVPAVERERVRRVAELERARLTATHPLTSMRLRLLEERPHRGRRVTLGEDDSAAIDGELTARGAAVASALVDGYRASLYR
jgi:Zn-dependent protease with chaperone function